MKYDRLMDLIEKMENQNASISELEELDLFYQSFENAEVFDFSAIDEDNYRAEFLTEIKKKIGFMKVVDKSVTRRLWPRISAIAASLILIACGIYFFDLVGRSDKAKSLIVHDIAPGKHGATLILSNGKKIRLTDSGNGELAKQTGIIITKTTQGEITYHVMPNTLPASGPDPAPEYNSLSTDKGETFEVLLPDKSKVWLNAASVLTFPIRLKENERRVVKLDGEAYFEIAKDKKHPFIVESNGQQVVVLGTHFNVNSYRNEPFVKTTLLEGSTKIISDNGSERILKPGQQSVLQGHKLDVNEVDIDEAIAWKNGDFVFNEEELTSIMRKLERWYNIDVEYQNASIGNKRFGGTISKFSNVSDVLRMLELTRGYILKLKEGGLS